MKLARHPRLQRGVTLVELMVGMAIGLLATLVIAQVAILYESQKRNTTSGSDALVGGALALNTLQRDLQDAGYGVTSGNGEGCSIQGRYNSTLYSWTLAPVVITDGSNGAPDSLRILKSSKAGYALPIRVFGDHLRSDSEFVLGGSNTDLNNVGNNVGDLMMAVPFPVSGTSVCALFTASRVCTAIGVGCTVANSIQHATGTSYPWNQDGNDGSRTVFPGNTAGTVAYPSGSYLVNLGRLTDRSYSINANSLQRVTFDSSAPASPTTEPMYSDIVNLQAVYGRDTSPTADQVVDVWDNTAPTTPDGWSRVVAVRIAVVARSNQYNKDEVTTVQPTWTPDGSTTTTIKVDQLTDWKHYRYRVFEAVVPLRNMLWQS